ncbi:MAG TPA: penicillin-insensitive murein endopeptidase [Kofleriaceae bacterium]|jgi:penicillin-insensitive murein endopeptidase|nr:penicillin-insensitive murein endopeptidase [Kofleriaceae bacterium]
MRRLLFAALLAIGATGCAELGAVSDGTSVSVGKVSGGYLINAAKLPDQGDGFMTRPVWTARDNRYGTDEMIALLTGVARRMKTQIKDVDLVVADISAKNGGAHGSGEFHRSHQTGRDADLLYYMRDKDGNPFEPDAMHVFTGRGWARDGSGITIDVARTWLLVKELVAAPEATVQFIFMYEPIAQLLIDHAKQIGEPPQIVARARRVLRQPGDSARHDDHLHVRVYCSRADRAFGCVDIGPMDALADREGEQSEVLELAGQAVSSAARSGGISLRAAN